MGIFRSGLSKTRSSFMGRIRQILGNTEIDDETWEDMEAVLIQSDLGVPTTAKVIEELQQRVKREGITQADQLHEALKETLASMLKFPPPLNISGRELSIMLVVG
ncbi:MAG: signal recognition particle-docking protein FtsY, partial [Phototrophicales bacterium]